jgi:hypothetical protein
MVLPISKTNSVRTEFDSDPVANNDGRGPLQILRSPTDGWGEQPVRDGPGGVLISMLTNAHRGLS